MLWKIHNIIQNITRIFRWLPVIWRDREYDHSFLLQILSFKLRLMEEFYCSKWAISTDRKDVATKIHTCHLLCERLIKDEYFSMLGQELKMNCSKDGEIEIEILDGGCKLGICSDWIHYEAYMQHQDLEYLCKIIQKHLFSWWD